MATPQPSTGQPRTDASEEARLGLGDVQYQFLKGEQKKWEAQHKPGEESPLQKRERMMVAQQQQLGMNDTDFAGLMKRQSDWATSKGPGNGPVIDAMMQKREQAMAARQAQQPGTNDADKAALLKKQNDWANNRGAGTSPAMEALMDQGFAGAAQKQAARPNPATTMPRVFGQSTPGATTTPTPPPTVNGVAQIGGLGEKNPSTQPAGGATSPLTDAQKVGLGQRDYQQLVEQEKQWSQTPATRRAKYGPMQIKHSELAYFQDRVHLDNRAFAQLKVDQSLWSDNQSKSNSGRLGVDDPFTKALKHQWQPSADAQRIISTIPSTQPGITRGPGM